jgi:hypothetical protein
MRRVRQWVLREVRGLRPDHNPLRRRVDRAETYLIGGLLVAAVVATPLAANAAGDAVYAGALRLQHEQLADRHQVEAVLTQPASASAGAFTFTDTVPTAASWTSPSGVHRSGEVLAWRGSPRGSVVDIWTDVSGTPVGPPLTGAQLASEQGAATVGVGVGTAVVSLALVGLVHGLAHRRRMAAWARDWQITAQVWNRQSW